MAATDGVARAAYPHSRMRKAVPRVSHAGVTARQHPDGTGEQGRSLAHEKG